MSIPLLSPNDYTFPDPFYALEECDGVVGISRDLDTGRLLSAYRQGIFPVVQRRRLVFLAHHRSARRHRA